MVPTVGAIGAAMLLLSIASGLAWESGARDLPLPKEVGAGQSLFHGLQPLQARVGGHTQPLPASAVTCANCHRTEPGTPQALAVGGRDTGPVLNASTLQNRVERRGGPPSHYDRDAFCRTLRTGEDPAGVLLPRVMPRYTLDDSTCDALWRFLVSQPR